MEQFFATCPRGLEALLERELTELGAQEVATTFGGVRFAGPLTLCYRVNLWSRLASRVLWRLRAAPYQREDDVYAAVHGIDWPALFSSQRSIAVAVTGRRSPLKSLDFITLRIKDAVCDRFRADVGERPDVDTRAPQVPIFAFLDERAVTIYIDTSGEPLYKRGYRDAAVEAPLKENLAAGMLQLCGWQPHEVLLDPMCGSATLLIEAALMTLKRAPGAQRSFAFEQLAGFDAKQWQRERETALPATASPAGVLPIYGSDMSATAMRAAKSNVVAAGLGGLIQLRQAQVLDISPPAPSGVMVMNPPYGVRIGEQDALQSLYPHLGDALKQKFAGWRVYILSADLQLPKLLGLRASRRTPLYNGALECRLLEYQMVSGSNRATRSRDGSNRP